MENILFRSALQVLDFVDSQQMHFGLFGSVLTKKEPNDIDFFVFCPSDAQKAVCANYIKQNKDLFCKVSWNGYSTKKDRHSKAVDITLFDNEQALRVFLDRNPQAIQSISRNIRDCFCSI